MKRLVGIVLLALGCAREGIKVASHARQIKHPTVVLHAPRINAIIPWNTSIAIQADVRDLRGAVVEFVADGGVFARDGAPPYEALYKPSLPGPLVITAQVRDAHGSVIASDAVSVMVVNPHPATDTDEFYEPEVRRRSSH